MQCIAHTLQGVGRVGQLGLDVPGLLHVLRGDLQVRERVEGEADGTALVVSVGEGGDGVVDALHDLLRVAEEGPAVHEFVIFADPDVRRFDLPDLELQEVDAPEQSVFVGGKLFITAVEAGELFVVLPVGVDERAVVSHGVKVPVMDFRVQEVLAVVLAVDGDEALSEALQHGDRRGRPADAALVPPLREDGPGDEELSPVRRLEVHVLQEVVDF